MRTIIGIIFIAALAWFGYWFAGSSALETATKAWLQDRQDHGWVAEYSSLEVNGFPNRFDTTVMDFNLADPQYGWAWQVPQFQVSTLSYTPNQFTAVWPDTQTISTPYETYNISNEDMRASIVFTPNTTLALERFRIFIKDLKITTSADEQSTFTSANLNTRQSEKTEFAHDIAFSAKGFVPSRSLKAKIDPKSILPADFETVVINATAHFDAPWDRIAIEAAKPNLTGIDITQLDAKWGEVQIQATGSVTVDLDGYPTGKIAVRAKNWREMIQLVVASGALDATVGQSLETGLGLIAMLSGNKNTLDIPLSFANRIVSLGPIPIGPAPRLKRY
jgi:hypothetical protein